jgi:hypothetical protein
MTSRHSVQGYADCAGIWREVKSIEWSVVVRCSKCLLIDLNTLFTLYIKFFFFFKQKWSVTSSVFHQDVNSSYLHNER